MYNPGINRSGQTAQHSRNSLLTRLLSTLRENATKENFVGLLAALFALFCLLFLPSSNFWNIRLPLYLIVVIWTLLRPRVALYLLPITIPWGSLDTINLGGLNVNSTDILVVLLTVSWLLSFVLRSQGVLDAGPLDHDTHALPRYLVIAVLALLFTMLLSTITALSIRSSLKEIIKWIEVLIVVLVGAKYLRTRSQVWTLIVIMLLAGISQACYGYTQNYLNLGPQSFIRDAGLRVYGTFGQPNPYAGFINMSLPIALSLTILGGNWATRILAGLAALLLGFAEYLTKSNGGEIAITAAILLIVTVGLLRLRPLLAAGAIGALTIVAAYLAGLIPQRFVMPILSKLGLVQLSFQAPSSQDFSTAERLAHWIAGIRMFLDHPFIGVGIGNYSNAYPPYHITIFVNSLDHAHNYYINTAAETGIVGLTAFLLFLIAIFVAGGHAYRVISKKCMRLRTKWANPRVGIPVPQERNTFKQLVMFTNDRALAIGLIAALLAVCVHNVVDNLYVHGMATLFALLLVALIRLAEVPLKAANNGGQRS